MAKERGDLVAARSNSFVAKKLFMATVLAGIVTTMFVVILRQFGICIGIPCDWNPFGIRH